MSKSDRPSSSAPPKPVQNGMLARIRHLREDFPPTARRIADFIETNAEEVIRMSITELAEQTGASEGSVVGLCRRVGAGGFQDLKILLAGDLVKPVRFIQEDLQETDDFTRVGERIFSAHAASLAETRKLLSFEALERAVAIVQNARRIEVYGIGSSAPIAQDLAYRLLQLGLDAKAVVDSHVQAVSAAMASAEVAAITVSHSGSTVETVLATRLAKEAGAMTVGITRLGKSPLARHCDVVLHTVANETRYRPEAMSSRVAQLAIIDTLVSCCALGRPEHSAEKLQLSARVLSEKRF
jgi:RpiR family transcriptional regulator, carbohydrate utilization regulator